MVSFGPTACYWADKKLKKKKKGLQWVGRTKRQKDQAVPIIKEYWEKGNEEDASRDMTLSGSSTRRVCKKRTKDKESIY